MKQGDFGHYYPLDTDDLPDGWSLSLAGEVAIEVRPGFASGKHNQSGKGVPHIRPMNIDREGRIDLTQVKSVSPDKNPLRLNRGDVLFNNTNSPALVGKTTAITVDEDWAYSNHMTRLTLPESVDNRFVAHQLHYLWMRGYFRHRCVHHVNQASISSSALSETVPLLMAPEPEQRRIVAKIEELFSYLDAGVAALERAKANLKRYRAAVLKAAVEGKLTEQWRAEHADGLPAPRPNIWHVYAIECDDESIYIGHTDDLPRRWQEHREGKGAQWAKTHRPRYVMHWEEFPSREEAAAREKWLKTGFGRKWLKRERAAGRTRQAGEPAPELLNRILAERRKKWEEEQLAKYEAKGKKPPTGWKEKYKEPAQPDTTNLRGLPEGWCWGVLDAVAVSQNGRAFPSKQYCDDGVKLLRPGNLFADGSVQWHAKNTRRMPQSWEEDYPEHVVGPNELIMNLTAQSLKDEFLGRTCITREGEHCLLNQRLARITPLEGMDVRFTLYLLKSAAFREFVNGLNTGSLIQHMFTSQLAEFVFALPPLAEQHHIVEETDHRVSVIDEIMSEIDMHQARASRLRQSILKRAFKGKLVPQDPNDEPASVLLERIKKEREAAEAKAKRKKAKTARKRKCREK